MASITAAEIKKLLTERFPATTESEHLRDSIIYRLAERVDRLVHETKAAIMILNERIADATGAVNEPTPEGPAPDSTPFPTGVNTAPTGKPVVTQGAQGAIPPEKEAELTKGNGKTARP